MKRYAISARGSVVLLNEHTKGDWVGFDDHTAEMAAATIHAQSLKQLAVENAREVDRFKSELTAALLERDILKGDVARLNLRCRALAVLQYGSDPAIPDVETTAYVCPNCANAGCTDCQPATRNLGPEAPGGVGVIDLAARSPSTDPKRDEKLRQVSLATVDAKLLGCGFLMILPDNSFLHVPLDRIQLKPESSSVEPTPRTVLETDTAPGGWAAPLDTGGTVELRTCEFCGCKTNARLRRCCNKGYEVDRAPVKASGEFCNCLHGVCMGPDHTDKLCRAENGSETTKVTK